VGSNLTEGGEFFPRKEPPPGHGWVVLTVGWWKEERHSSNTTARSAGFKSQAGWASHGCCVLYSCCVVQKGKRKREGERGWPGIVPRSPAAHKEKKERKKQADRKGKGYIKKYIYLEIFEMWDRKKSSMKKG
jgi:hypothetical protein